MATALHHTHCRIIPMAAEGAVNPSAGRSSDLTSHQILFKIVPDVI